MSHEFKPQGVTVLALLAESHVSIHTYPERGFCAIDAYTCGDTADPVEAVRYITDAIGATKVERRIIERGRELSDM